VKLVVGYGDELVLEPDRSVNVAYEVTEFTLSRRPASQITHTLAMNLIHADAVDDSACSGN
jgi:hypothetical protein